MNSQSKVQLIEYIALQIWELQTGCDIADNDNVGEKAFKCGV